MKSTQDTLLFVLLLATGPAVAQNVLYQQGFEGEFDKPRMHTNSKDHTIHFQGASDERATEGKRSYKIDVTFRDGDHFYLMFPAGNIPIVDGTTARADLFLEKGGHAGPGHNLGVPHTRPPDKGPLAGCAPGKLWPNPTGEWKTLATKPNELRNQGEENCYGLLTNPKYVGVSGDYLPLYFKVADPLYEAWYINIRFMKGRRVVLYVDDVRITSPLSSEAARKRTDEGPARFKRQLDSLMGRLDSDLAGAEKRAGRVSATQATKLARLRGELDQARAAWKAPPVNMHEWLLRAVAVGRFAKGVDGLALGDDPTTRKRRSADVSVFAVKPIVPAADVPMPDKPPGKAARGAKVALAVCPGEVEFGSLCVYAGAEALPDVTIRVSDLVGSAESDERPDAYLAPLPEPWKFKPDPDDRGVAGEWFKPDLDDSAWAEIRTDVEKGWDGQGFEKQRIGYGWYRQRLAANPEFARHKHRYLYFQAVDEDAYVYLDGKLVFEHTERTTGLGPDKLWIAPFAVDLDKLWSGERDASLVVRVYNRMALGGVWKPVYLLGADSAMDAERMKWMVFEHQTGPAYVPERRIAAECFDPYVVKWWYRVNPDDKQGPPFWRGELLLKDASLVTPDHEKKRNTLKTPTKEVRDAEVLQPITLAARGGVQYFLIGRFPSSTPAGRYMGNVAILSRGDVIAELPIEVTVLPFPLSDPLLDYTIYYRGGKLGAKPNEFAPFGSEYKTDAQLEADIADIMDHGIRRIIWYASADRILAMRRRFGIKGALMTVYPNAPRADQTDYIKWSANAIEQLRAGGCGPIYIAGPDEPGVDKMAYTRELIDNTHRLLGVKVFTAVCRPLSWENLRQHVDLPIVYVERFGHRRGVAEWQGDGKPVYTYGVASFHSDGHRFRRYYGLGAWKAGCDGGAPYAYQHTGGDPWDSLTWQCNFTWPTVNGRISTLQWEGMRSAITDVRYLATLIAWLGKTAGPLADHPARVAAERALAAVNEAGDLDAERARLIRHTIALKSAMGKVPD